MFIILLFERAMWEQKKKEDEDLLQREVAEVRELSRSKMFGRFAPS